ncbi:MAG: TetR/AcrR family transcriptional regulator [Planctomycetota bacterium]|jgi:AcrR family transcriptional regulator
MQERALATRERILDAAETIFAEKGYHGSRIDEIADQAGANKQRIYAYFGNKEGLFSTTLRRVYEHLLEEEGALLKLASTDAASLTHRLLEHYMSYHHRYPNFWRMVGWSNLESVITPEAIRDVRGGTFEHLKEIYSGGQAAGLFSREISFETFLFAISALSFFYLSNQRTMSKTIGLNLDSPKVRKRLLKEMVLLLNQGLMDAENHA